MKNTYTIIIVIIVIIKTIIIKIINITTSIMIKHINNDVMVIPINSFLLFLCASRCWCGYGGGVRYGGHLLQHDNWLGPLLPFCLLHR